MSGFVLAHPLPPLAPAAVWPIWNTDPWVVVPLELFAMVYAWGIWNVWQRAGAGHGISAWRAISFAGGLLALAGAWVSPLDAAASELFSAHMAQHLILMLVAAPLLVASDFPLALLWALPR